ncbi:MAG: hypothetical protein LBH24_03670 [Clostridiales bacterium]|jgi:hypothetical protein|nr:hypothetical protein [Clostridiales bacterium]
MSIFKSAQQKETEEKILIRRAVGNIKRYIQRLSASRRRYIEEAKSAKLHDVPAQYKLAKSALAMVIGQQTVAEQLLLTMELSAQMKDTAAVAKAFSDGMNTLSGEINKLNARLDFGRTGRRVGRAMAETQLKNEEMGLFLAESNEEFSALNGDAGLSDELDALIEREAVLDGGAGLSDEEKEIAERLKKL